MIDKIYLTDERRYADPEPINYETVNERTGCYGYSSYFEEFAIGYGDLSYNAERDRYEMTQEAYEWWARVVSAQTEMDMYLAELKEAYDPDKLEGMLNGLDNWGCGLERIPYLCAEVKNLAMGFTGSGQDGKLTGV